MRLNGTVFSKILNMDTGITVVTPNQMKENELYNVVYLLHGLCGNHQTWLDYSMLATYASVGQSIYIMPEVSRSFYTDMKYGLKYLTYVTEELLQICQSIFNIASDREHTVIMGCSMGGYGALKCALFKPEQYGICCAFSSSCLFIQEGLENLRNHSMRQNYIDNFGKELIQDFQAIFGENFEYRKEDDILELMKHIDCLPQIYLTCGKQDMFYQDHIRFCKKLDQLHVSYEFEQWEAQHDFVYFNDALKKAISKYDL